MEKKKQEFCWEVFEEFRKTYFGLENPRVNYSKTIVSATKHEISKIYEHHSFEDAILKSYMYEQLLTESFPLIYGRHLGIRKCC